MLKLHRTALTALVLALLLACAQLSLAQPGDPLPSWNDGPNKTAILDFVHKVTREGSPDFVPVPERIATFDNDGTLWAEKPLYFQVFFILDRVKAMAPQHPEWQTREPFASVLKGDLKGAFSGGDQALVALALAAQTGMSTADFAREVQDWIATARHPQTGMLFTEMVYQPMLELLGYLRANGFKTFIVSGGGIEFMRPWTERVYGVPPEQVVGSSFQTQYEMTPDGPVLMRLPKIAFVDDREGKPVGINAHIGRRPVAAFGNSDGDIQMLEWTTVGQKGARLAMLVHHTDAAREYAYDKGTEKALKEATARGWNIVDMKDDWNVIYPSVKK
ncbi:nonspecific acid phosphatase precursor [Solidesulfovibrio fructosivorans JJ]]|uniref:Nonspecific acid phosphatase n=1 Tax=Solidesulfovibrio fructosivorans JJ] TaxID=596151 RepID=E1JSR1_SOLFR|nr:HAD family hydrolase [Solidesulfovibrio fructosivorans]EFL52544.1 nonspecific acid phosphatase precursor [Solidesulfovibrio fructosivorans JJ]]